MCRHGKKKINNLLFLFLLPRIVMEWTKQQLMTVNDLFQFQKGTLKRSQVWDSIADDLNAMDYPCRDCWTPLRTKYKRRMSELQASQE